MNERSEHRSADPWVPLRRLLAAGDAAGAAAAAGRSLAAHPNDAALWALLGLAHLQLKNVADADLALSRAMTLAGGEDPELLNAMGIVRSLQRQHAAAIDLFSRCLHIRSFHRDALGNLADLYTTLKQPGNARPLLGRLIRIQPESADAHARASDNALALDDAAEALRLGRKAVRLSPRLVAGRLALADALEASGKFGAAKLQYLAILLHQPSNAMALSQLLSLQGVAVEEQHAGRAEQLLQSCELPDSERVSLRLALARYRDSEGRHAEAFAHLQAGKSLHFKNHAFDSDAFSREVDRLMAVGVAPARGGEAGALKPIFIVGMPRSGTTLVEQILASHSAVAAGGELPTIMNIAAELRRASMDPGPSGLLPEMRDRLARRYLEALKEPPPGTTRVTDKMPFNFLHLGLIAALFPDAAIIHCRRGALDTCLSCYFTGFSEQLAFASDLRALGRYWLDYRRLMAHWQSVLPLRVLQVSYERLVAHTGDVVREMLDFCGLEWQEACLEFHRNSRAVRTPSRWQVRQPIYAQSIGRWRHYETHLRPLIDVLSSAAAEESM